MAQSPRISPTPLQDAIQSIYTKLTNHLCTKDIREELFENKIITMPLKQTIQSKDNSKEANESVIDHLYNSGTVELVKRFIQVLRDTSSSYAIHEEVALDLEGALRVHNVTIQSLPNQSESIIRPFWEMIKEKNVRLQVVPPEMTTKELMFVDLAVVKADVQLKKERDVSDFVCAVIEGIDNWYKNSESIRYEDVLSSSKYVSGKRIVISGPPGCGKTTLSRKYCKDLSSGILPNDYQLVLLFHLRELTYCLKKNEDLTFNHFLAKYSSRCDVPSIIDRLLKTGGKGILLILDGYDEISEDMMKSSFMKKLLSPSSCCLDECDLIVTTRPFACPKVLAGMEHNCVHVEILGFTEEKIHSFIDNYFQRTGGLEMAERLKKKLQILPLVKGMCRLPIVLKIICKVQEYLEDKGLPHTMGGIYSLYIKRQLLHDSHLKIKLTSILEIPEDIFPEFSSLCQISYTFCVIQQLVLSDNDLGKEMLKLAKRGSIYELLFAESAADLDLPIQLFTFVHKTVQEALAAVHIAKQSKLEQQRIWSEQFGRPEMAEVWKFYCNFTKLQNIDVFSLLPTVFSQLPARDDQSDNTQLPARDDQSDNTQLPARDDQSDNTQLPARDDQSDNTQLPARDGQSDNTQLPARDDQSDNTQLPARDDQSDNTQLPARDDQSDNTQLPARDDQSDNTQLPARDGQSDNTQLPARDGQSDNTQLPARDDQSDITQLPARDDQSDNTQLPARDGQSDNTQLPARDGQSDNTQLPARDGQSDNTQLPARDDQSDNTQPPARDGQSDNTQLPARDGQSDNTQLPARDGQSDNTQLPARDDQSLHISDPMYNFTRVLEQCYLNDLKMLLMISFFEADNKELSQQCLPQIIEDELFFRINSTYETVVLQYTLQHHDKIRALKIMSSESVKTHFHLVLPAILSQQHLTALEIKTITVDEDCSIIIPEKCLVSCQKLNLIHMKLTSNQLAKLLKGIDKAMKEVYLSRCIQTKEDTGDSDIEIVMKNLHVEQLNLEEGSDSISTIESMVSGVLQNRYVNDLSIIIIGENNLTLNIPEECLVNCQKCFIELSLTLQQWTVLVSNIAQVKPLKQVALRLNICQKETNEPADPIMHESIKAALEKLPSLKRFCILCGDVRSFPLMRSLLLGALYNKSTTEVYINMDSEYFDLSVENFFGSWYDATEETPISSSLECTLNGLELSVHEWTELFIEIAQSERLEEIKVPSGIMKDTTEEVAYDKLLTSLQKMPCLKGFTLFSNKMPYQLIKSLLLGVLDNLNTMKVYIREWTEEFGGLDEISYDTDFDEISISSSPKCAVNLKLAVHEWVELFTGFMKADRFEEITIFLRINELISNECPEAFCEICCSFRCPKVKIYFKSGCFVIGNTAILMGNSTVESISKEIKMSVLAIMWILIGFALNPRNIEFTMNYGGILSQELTLANILKKRLPSPYEGMFDWSEVECVLKPLEKRQQYIRNSTEESVS